MSTDTEIKKLSQILQFLLSTCCYKAGPFLRRGYAKIKRVSVTDRILSKVLQRDTENYHLKKQYQNTGCQHETEIK